MISLMVMSPEPSASPAGQSSSGASPRAMFTMRTSSFTVTSPLPSQSPTQVGTDEVAVALGVGVGGAGVAVGAGGPGLTGTAIMDQLGELRLHDMMTVEAPGAVLPPPAIPSAAPEPALTLARYSCVCSAPFTAS